MIDPKTQILYLYDLPKERVTSVQIAKIIRERANYELQEPVQFRDCRVLPNGLPSDFQYGICKIDNASLPAVAEAMKYFTMDLSQQSKDGKPLLWHCRALPFDRELLGVNKNGTNQQLNVFVRNIDGALDASKLDESFRTVFGPVKSAKVSLSIKRDKKNPDLANQPASSNGYGFVCFQNAEDANKAVKAGSLNGMQVIRYQVRDARELQKSYNNIYVKNFNPAWTKEKLQEIFSRYGEIKSCVIMSQKSKKDGEERPFAFVCFDKEGDAAYGRQAADNAVVELHDKELDGFKLYVQPAIPADQRQAQVQRDQIRFKNSKKKCNLFVKNFPPNYTKERLAELFGQCGEIESIKVIEGASEDGRPQGVRAFICYKQPDSATSARARFHNQQLEGGKNLYVTNYELPEVRRRQQIENKDKADFFTQKKNNTLPLEASLLNRPDTFQMIHQILQLIQKSVQGRFPQPGFNNQRGPNNQGGRYPPRNPMGPQQQGRQPYPNNRPGYNQQVPQPVPLAPAPLPTATAVEIKGASHLAHAEP